MLHAQPAALPAGLARKNGRLMRVPTTQSQINCMIHTEHNLSRLRVSYDMTHPAVTGAYQQELLQLDGGLLLSGPGALDTLA